MKQFSRMPACGLLVIALAFSSPAVAQTTNAQAPDEMMSRDNVSITVRFGALEGSQRVQVKSYAVVVASGTVGSKLLSGQRVPIPMTHEPGEGGVNHAPPLRFAGTLTAQTPRRRRKDDDRNRRLGFAKK